MSLCQSFDSAYAVVMAMLVGFLGLQMLRYGTSTTNIGTFIETSGPPGESLWFSFACSDTCSHILVQWSQQPLQDRKKERKKESIRLLALKLASQY